MSDKLNIVGWDRRGFSASRHILDQRPTHERLNLGVSTIKSLTKPETSQMKSLLHQGIEKGMDHLNWQMSTLDSWRRRSPYKD